MKTLSNIVAVLCLVVVAMRLWGGGSILPPSVDPIPGDEFRVMIVYESDDLDNYPRGQVDAMYSSEVRQYLMSNCPANGFRILDKDADLGLDLPIWQEAMKRERQGLPWLLIDAQGGGYEGPLPATPEALLELLKKHKGAT